MVRVFQILFLFIVWHGSLITGRNFYLFTDYFQSEVCEFLDGIFFIDQFYNLKVTYHPLYGMNNFVKNKSQFPQ